MKNTGKFAGLLFTSLLTALILGCDEKKQSEVKSHAAIRYQPVTPERVTVVCGRLSASS